jgi:hypothetical protein
LGSALEIRAAVETDFEQIYETFLRILAPGDTFPYRPDTAQARDTGCTEMQFNYAVSTNEAAVWLWRQIGIKIVGTVPGNFMHATLGPVDTYVMHRFLESALNGICVSNHLCWFDCLSGSLL